MAWFKNIGGFIVCPKPPAIDFMTIDRVLSMALVLLKTSKGGADAYGQLHSFIYSCLIYDQYASEWKQQYLPKNSSQWESWKQLATLPCLVAQDQKALNYRYHSRTIGKAKITLPILSLDPQRHGRGAPSRLQNDPAVEYESGSLSLDEFIEVAYMVRCNLLHGSYDIRNDDHAAAILMTGLRFTNLLRWMVENTSW